MEAIAPKTSTALYGSHESKPKSLYYVGVKEEPSERRALHLTGSEGKRQKAESREQRAESREQRAESREQRAESREQRAESREQRAESREQRAESREQRAEMLLNGSREMLLDGGREMLLDGSRGKQAMHGAEAKRWGVKLSES